VGATVLLTFNSFVHHAIGRKVAECRRQAQKSQPNLNPRKCQSAQKARGQLEGAKPLQKSLLPLSSIGEGDTGGEVDK